MDAILEETLREMHEIRRAIPSRFWWYYHLTPVRNADGIRQQGIIPNFDLASTRDRPLAAAAQIDVLVAIDLVHVFPDLGKAETGD
jgi:hypothetical protein